MKTQPQEIIPADTYPTKIEIVEKFRRGVSKASKPFNLGFIPDNSKRRICNVVRMQWHPKGRQKKGSAVAYDWKIIEVLALFEGPTAHQSAAE
jgi:hypothetical protein